MGTFQVSPIVEESTHWPYSQVLDRLDSAALPEARNGDRDQTLLREILDQSDAPPSDDQVAFATPGDREERIALSSGGSYRRGYVACSRAIQCEVKGCNEWSTHRVYGGVVEVHDYCVAHTKQMKQKTKDWPEKDRPSFLLIVDTDPTTGAGCGGSCCGNRFDCEPPLIMDIYPSRAHTVPPCSPSRQWLTGM